MGRNAASTLCSETARTSGFLKVRKFQLQQNFRLQAVCLSDDDQRGSERILRAFNPFITARARICKHPGVF